MGVACRQPISHSSQAQEDNSFFGGPPTYYSYKGYALQVPTGSSIPVSHGLMHPSGVFPNRYPFNAQPVYPLSNEPIYLNQGPSGLFTDYTICVTLFVRWIEDHPLPDGLKMPSHVGSYNGKGDRNNFLHLFEGTICMQKWEMLVACHMFTYTLEDSTRIWWNGQNTGSILNYEYLKAKLRSHFSQQKKFTKTHLTVHNIKQREGESIEAFVTRSLLEFLFTKLSTGYKGLMKKTYTWIEAIEVTTNGTPNDRRENSERFKRDSSWDNNK
ncbi:hypothetical protein Tco_1543501, partial [Tanacetum coccineum]